MTANWSDIFHERCRILAEASPTAMLISSMAEGMILHANPRAASTLGCRIEEIVGRKIADFFQEHAARELLSRDARQNHFHLEKESLIRKTDGASFWAAVLHHSMVLEGHAVLITGFYDITTRKHAEAALRASEERYRALFENNPSMYFTVNWEGTVVAVNRFGAEQLGYMPADLIGRSVLEVFYEEDKAEVTRQLQHCIANPERVHDWEFRKVHRSGRIIWVKEAARAMREADGKILVLIVCEDISHRRQTEDEIRKLNQDLEQRVIQRTQALRESEEKFRQLAENIQTVFWMNAPSANELVYISPAYEKIWGHPTSRLDEKPRAFLDDILADDRHLMLELLRKQERGEPYEGEYRIARPDGDIRWIHDRGFPIVNEHGEVYRFAGIAEDVTASKRAQEELRVSEERYRTLAESAQDFVYILDRNGKIEYVNHAGATNFGRKPEEMIGKPLREVFPAQEAPRLWERIQSVFNTGIATRNEVEVHFPGHKLWVDNQLIPLRDQAQTVYAIMGVSRDVTARKKMEQYLVENERFFRSAFDHAPIGMTVVTLDGHFIKVNEAFTRMLGYSREELLQLTFQSITHPEDLATDLTLTRDSLRQGAEQFQLEKRYLHKHGQVVWVDLSVSIVRDESSLPMYLVAKILDITQSKRAAEALRASEERYRTLAESAQDFVYIISREGVIQYLNHFAAAFFQSEPDAIIGKHFSELFQAQEAARLWRRVQEVFNSGEVMHRETEIHFPHQVLWIDNRLVPLRDRDNQVYAILGLSRDITARKEMEEQLRQYNTGLETLIADRTRQMREMEKQREENEKLAATGRMAARIAHEINNPLGFIQFAFQLLSRDLDPLSRHHHYVGKIEKEIERIAGIIRQMLEVHRPQRELPQTFRPADTIQDVLLMMQPLTTARGVTVAHDSEGAGSNLTLPENMLRQVLYNVVLNAVEASAPESCVQVMAQAQADLLTITITDHGHGIAEEVQPRIFEPFFTTKSATKNSGMGLGLSICKSLVEAMNGTIKITSRVGTGTVCQITLPIKD